MSNHNLKIVCDCGDGCFRTHTVHGGFVYFCLTCKRHYVIRELKMPKPEGSTSKCPDCLFGWVKDDGDLLWCNYCGHRW